MIIYTASSGNSYTLTGDKPVRVANMRSWSYDPKAIQKTYGERVSHFQRGALKYAVTITVNSQRSLSNWDAKIYFELSGSEKCIGRYNIFSDNEQSNIPEMIAKQIKIEIFEHVGLL